MSYQVLARKWRPQNFQALVGQEHVLRALEHALDQQRLHHAYLFTGTRGVGKTTIGRIFAKCLNCEQGIGSRPCGVCGACREITEGRFVDLIEIDAASRTKVEEMRELLENVPFAPTRGRFKIYLIDEVHMLSASSFNALLKTLEEPPEHVKFLFATTDPQKLPVTILSRCLQFCLKSMTPERIVQHLSHVLEQEQVGFDDPALWLIARAAAGSMRDALSLTDQAIAFGHGRLEEASVASMLGSVDRRVVYRLLEALTRNHPAGMLAEVAHMADFAPDYADVLAALLSVLHRITLEQVVPGSCDNAMGDKETVVALAKRFSGEDVQLFYQIALMGRKDLLLSPDPRAGFEMVLLRMFAFRPRLDAQGREVVELHAPTELQSPRLASTSADASAESVGGGQHLPGKLESVKPGPEGEARSSTEADNQAEAPKADVQDEDGGRGSVPVSCDDGADYSKDAPAFAAALTPLECYAEMVNQGDESADDARCGQPDEKMPATGNGDMPEDRPLSGDKDVVDPEVTVETVDNVTVAAVAECATDTFWPVLIDQLGLSGLTYNLASNAQAEFNSSGVILTLAEGHFRLLNDNHRMRIKEGFQQQFGQSYRVEFTSVAQVTDTPQRWKDQQRALKLEQTLVKLQNDAHVNALLQAFDGRLVLESVQVL